MTDVDIRHGDCLKVLRDLPDNSVDSVVTDPPYGLSNTKPQQVADVLAAWVTGDTEAVPTTKGGFMGKDWDSFVPPPAVWQECLRVLKPGGHMAVFSGARTQDLMGLSIRLAGFEVRDVLGWVYSQGMPKSMDISKAIDKRGGNAHLAKEIGKAIRESRESRGLTKGWCDLHFCGGTTNWTWFEGRPTGIRPPSVETFNAIVNEWPELAPYAEKVAEVEREVVGAGKSGKTYGMGGLRGVETSEGSFDITAPATSEAERWDGWGTALKPAIEPIILARKPLVGTVAQNVLEHGVGGLNIDACRVGMSDADREVVDSRSGAAADHDGEGWGNIGKFPEGRRFKSAPAGRFPANVLLDEHAAEEMDKQSGWSKSPDGLITQGGDDHFSIGSGERKRRASFQGHGDSGGASRFFPVFKYQAKAPKRERPVVEREDGTKIQHPTVKPEKLMDWLVTLTTPPGGTVLDPFAGTGTTLQAARNKGLRAIGVEQDPDYIRLIETRLEGAAEDGGLF